jgi:hypothetical protein
MNEQTNNQTNISKAFCAAQKAFAPALKTATNPHFKSKYADLAACIEAVIDSLNSNGIALIQKPHLCESGVTIETVFIHESGEQISGGILHVPASKNDPQGYGSALTYARRYSLMAACGIAPEDDDGNAATKPRQSPQKPQEKPAEKQPTFKAQTWSLVRAHYNDNATAFESGLKAIHLLAENETLAALTEDRWKSIFTQLSEHPSFKK